MDFLFFWITFKGMQRESDLVCVRWLVRRRERGPVMCNNKSIWTTKEKFIKREQKSFCYIKSRHYCIIRRLPCVSWNQMKCLKHQLLFLNCFLSAVADSTLRTLARIEKFWFYCLRLLTVFTSNLSIRHGRFCNQISRDLWDNLLDCFFINLILLGFVRDVKQQSMGQTTINYGSLRCREAKWNLIELIINVMSENKIIQNSVWFKLRLCLLCRRCSQNCDSQS